MKMKFFLLVIITNCCFVFADRGLIPFDHGVEIFEPNQRAIIAWNGEEEILLLSTDLSASDSTMVLEILPLPSEPKVKKGDPETFRRAINLINRRIYIKKRNGNGDKFGEGKIPPPAEITLHEKIGAHDISVVHLIEKRGFIDWVKNYVQNLGYDKEVISQIHQDLVEDYINRNFTWFVFDVITLSKETKTLEPIQYRFPTRRLFYPLKITSLSSGYTTIELMVLTPKLLSKFSGISLKHIHLTHDPITIYTDDLKIIDEDMYELLKDNTEMKLRIWKIEGELNSFDKDLIAH